MEAAGETLKTLGFGLAFMALATAAVALIVKVIMLVVGRQIHPKLRFLGFRSHLIAMIGVQIAILGMILAGRVPWPFLLSLFVFGLPAVVALRAPLDWPGPLSPRGRR